MKQKTPQSSVIVRYTALLIAVIAALAGAFSLVLLRFAAERFERYELSTVENSLQIAADDLENQYEIISDIATKIQVTSYYQPSILYRDAYREIDLLKDFVNFKNFSPILKQYFMFYPLASQANQKIYTSEGNTAYFPFYAANHLGLKGQETEKLFQTIAQTTVHRCITVDENLLLVFPLRFITTTSAENTAVVVFVLPVNNILNRMQQIASKLPDNISLCIHDAVLLNDKQLIDNQFEPGITRSTDGHHQIRICSQEGSIQLASSIYQNKWHLVLSSLSGWIFAGLALCLLATVVVSAAIAQLIARPLRSLVQQHMPPGERLKNEFVQLEELMCRMERENGSSMKQLRSRILLTILRGYYSENLLQRWGLLNLRFNCKHYCVLVIDAGSMTAEQAELRTLEVEKISSREAVYYAVYVPDDRVIAVIAGFNVPEAAEHQRLMEMIQSWQVVGSTGKTCDTPQRLSISYMEAMTAHLRMRKWQSEDLSDMHTFAVQMITAAKRRDEDSMRIMCDQLMLQLDGHNAPRSLVNQLAVQLTTELSKIAGETHTELDYQRAGMLILLPDLRSLLHEACDLISATFSLAEDQAESRTDTTAQSIVEYVQENAFDPDFDLSRIADSFGLSNDYVSAMIKKVTGSAFKEYLTELRLQQACKLLREKPDLTVNEISSQVGYRKVSNFIKKFKETYGCTPTQYR